MVVFMKVKCLPVGQVCYLLGVQFPLKIHTEHNYTKTIYIHGFIVVS